MRDRQVLESHSAGADLEDRDNGRIGTLHDCSPASRSGDGDTFGYCDGGGNIVRSGTHQDRVACSSCIDCGLD